MSLQGKKIGILIESDYYEPEIWYYKFRFAEEGADVHFLTRLWGQRSITFKGHEHQVPLECNESFEGMDEATLKVELEDRLKKGISGEELIAGILPNKFGSAFVAILKTKDVSLIAKKLKSKEFNITGTRGWNEADFTAGGVDTAEVTSGTLESKIRRGLYFAGEILDVDGCRGGYNLAWAWASGYVAGLTQ